MKMIRFKQLLSFVVCIVLIAVTALFTIGCNDEQNSVTTNEETSAYADETSVSSDETSDTENGVISIGEGKSKFTFEVVDEDGKTTVFEVKTDKETVGEALTSLNIISGEQGAYGLYVKTVNGITADYDTNGRYWAFYIDGQYAFSGVDSTEINESSVYSFKVEKG